MLRDSELMEGTFLEGICGGIMGMGLIAAISNAFEKVKTLRKERNERERNLMSCFTEHDEVAVRIMVVETGTRKLGETTLFSS